MNPMEYESTQPTWCRWRVVSICTFMSLLLYLDRFCVNFAQSLIQDDLGLTKAQADLATTGFFWAYALSQIPAGWFSDRWGGRLMLTIYLFTWSLTTLLIGFAQSLFMLVGLRILLGIAQAGAYPTAAGLLQKWMPLGQRGIASSLVAFGGRVGGVLAPLLTAWLILQFVPATSSSTLQSRHVKADQANDWAAKFAKSLQDNSDSSRLHTQVWNQFSPDSRELVQRLAMTGAVAPTAAELILLSESLNSVIVECSLGGVPELNDLDLSLEIKQLQRIAGERELTPTEQQRLNRLVLEANYPKLLCKVYMAGWRPALWVYGIAGMLAAGILWFTLRNSPEAHPRCNLAEQKLIQAEQVVQTTAGPKPPVPWKRLLRSRSLWLSSISQFFTNIGWLFVVTSLPQFLEKIHNVPIRERSYMAGFAMVGGIIGMLLGGSLTDSLRIRLGLRWGRALPMGLTRFAAAASFIGMIFAKDPWTVTLCTCLVAFFTDLGVAATWAMMQDAGGKFVGVVLGFGNMWGNVGAGVFPLIEMQLLPKDAQLHHWHTVFGACALAFVISGVAGMWIDATQPIADEPEPTPEPTT